MAKKRSKKIAPTETIHFRPGERLGKLIDEFARGWGTSRGDAAKRLVVLASHGLDLDFYSYAEELMGYLDYGADLEDACQRIQIHLHETDNRRPSEGQPPLKKEARLEAVDILLRHYRLTREIEEQVEHQHVRVQIVLTPQGKSL